MFEAHKYSISNSAKLGLFGLDKSSGQVTDVEGLANFLKFNGVPSCCALAEKWVGETSHVSVPVGLAPSRSFRSPASHSSASPVSPV